MRSSFRFYCALVVIATLALSGCENGGGNGRAKVRVLNVSPDYSSLDFYASTDDDDTDKLKLSAITYDKVSGYTELKSDTYVVKFKRNGVASTLQTLSSKKFTDDSHQTYVAYGSTGHFAALELGEDVSDPDSGHTKLQLLNTSEAGSLDVYLTESTVSLEDASPTFANVSSGAAATSTTIDSGDYRLRVTGANDTDDLRLDVPNIGFGSKKIVSLILTATEGGVLVNVILLPQQGSLTKYANTKARVRGAVGISNGTAVTARVGGVTVLSSVAIGVVGNYTQVESGSAAVTLSVDGSPVAAASQNIAAGGEYTLLIWNNGGGTQTTLVGDDNRLPTTSGKAKIRVMNGLSTQDVPINMSVDFSPIAEGIALGLASAFKEVDAGSEYQLDVNNSSTAASLLSRSSVSLQAAGVYTMFISGSGATVNGTLRKDR
jgi:hypothetical protein